MNHPWHANAATSGCHDLLTALAGDGWETRTTVEQSEMRTRLTSPDRLLHMTIEHNKAEGTLRARVGTLPGGIGEPARWQACAEDPPTTLWCEAVRAAARARHAGHQPTSFHPGAVLEHLGWRSRAFRHDGSLATQYACPRTERCLTCWCSTRAAPALWRITRPETSVDITITAAEPYMLPALVLALLLRTPDRTSPSP